MSASSDFVPPPAVTSVKILNLVLFSTNHPAYIIMREIVRNHNRHYANVTTYFLDSGPEDKILGDTIYTDLHGEHPFVPGLLRKTINSIMCTKDMHYDLLVRSNVSNLIDFAKLVDQWIELGRPDFTGPGMLNPAPNPESGIFDLRFAKITFIGGWGMCFSPLAIRKLIENRRFLDYSIIDDVSISDFLLRKFIVYTRSIPKSRCDMEAKSYHPEVIFYRFNSGKDSRFDDAVNMEECSRRMRAISSSRPPD